MPSAGSLYRSLGFVEVPGAGGHPGISDFELVL
jgi:hypothetical protein